MKTKVSELTDEKLAERTARAQKWELVTLGYGCVTEVWVDDSEADYRHKYEKADYRPDINGAQAMELVNELNISVLKYEEGYYATLRTVDYKVLIDFIDFSFGESAEIAICRAVVASVYGEYVEEE